MENALEAESTPLHRYAVPWHSAPPTLPLPRPQQMGRILQCLDLPESREVLMTQLLTQPSPPSPGILTQLSFHPMLTSMCAVEPQGWVGGPDQETE